MWELIVMCLAASRHAAISATLPSSAVHGRCAMARPVAATMRSVTPTRPAPSMKRGGRNHPSIALNRTMELM